MKTLSSLSNFQIALLCSFISIAILLLDIVTPLGFAGGVPYIFVILLSLFSQAKNLTWRIAVITSVFTMIGFWLLPTGGEFWQIILNRILALFVIWCTAFLGVKLRTTLNEKQKKEKELQKIFDLSPDIIGKGTFLKGEFTEVNCALTKILGYEKAEFLSKPFIEFVHKDDVKKTLADAHDAMQGKGNLISNNRYQCKDGSYKHLEWNVLSDKNENAFYTVARDVTERVNAEKAAVQSQQKLERSQQIAHMGYWAFDFKTQVTQCSAEIYKIFELSSDQSLNSSIFFNLVHPADKKKLLQTYKKSQEDKQPYHIEYRLLFANNAIKTISLHGESSFDAKGSLLTSCGLMQDITEQTELKERMRNSQKMDALGKLTGGIAHDYNNMLGVIIGYSEILEKQLIEQPTLCNYAKQITNSAQKGAKLTNKLLSFSKKNNVIITCKVINELIEGYKEVIQKLLTSTITLQLNLASDLWCSNIDTYAFDDMLLNLCINAKYAMPKGGILTISTKNKSLSANEAKSLNLSGKDYTVLSIEDNGHGMPEEVKQQIFDPFFTTKGEQGTGLGLSQVFSFINASSGAIKVTSQLDKGSKFDIYLPKCLENKSEPKPKPKSAGVITTNISNSTIDKTILVVDDEEALVDLLTTILIDEGYQVLSATNGMEAISILKEHVVDLLLTDILMPKMNGYQLAEQTQALYPQMPIILTSGYQNSLDSLQTEKVLSLPLIKKPYKRDDLLSVIQKFLPISKPKPDLSNKNTKSLVESSIPKWSQVIAIDNGIIDEDHRQLFAILERCQQMNEHSEGFENKMKLLIDKLSLYTLNHFANEELAMKVCAYPHAKNHRDVHTLMVKELQTVIKNKSAKEIRVWFISYFSDWLLDHIMVMDKALTVFIEKKSDEVQQALLTMKEKR